jgi:hypothetical protein
LLLAAVWLPIARESWSIGVAHVQQDHNSDDDFKARLGAAAKVKVAKLKQASDH